MANPPNAKSFDQPLDPYDIEKFAITLTRYPASSDVPFPLLEAAEQVASFTLLTTAEATAAGLTIEPAGARAPVLVGDTLLLWLSVDPAQQGAALFSGAGVDLGIELSVTTNATPSRRKQKTYTVKVAQQ